MHTVENPRGGGSLGVGVQGFLGKVLTTIAFKYSRAFMGKIRQLPGAFSDRILERTELSETPNLENVEIDKNRKMFLCAPHKVYDQNKKFHSKQFFLINSFLKLNVQFNIFVPIII
jgi:hypothetical protein